MKSAPRGPTRAADRGNAGAATMLTAHGEGLSFVRQGPLVREQPQPLDGGHEAPLRPEPPEGADHGRRRSSPGVRVHALPQGRQGHQGTLRAAGPLRDPALVRFRTVVAGALAALESRRDEVNDLNVFPVADGDTGDNMVLTLRAVLEELDHLATEAGQIDKEVTRDEIVDRVARAALLGARGNSGVILSQLIRGAAEELASRKGELVDPVLVGAAMARAADRAYASVRPPAPRPGPRAGRGHDPHRHRGDGAPDRQRAGAHAGRAAGPGGLDRGAG